MPPVPVVPPEPASSDKPESENPRSGNDAARMSNGTNDTNGILHTSISNEVLDYFDIDKVEIVNIHTATGFPICDAYIGRKWKDSYGPRPLVGADGDFGNKFTVAEYVREECLRLYEEYLKSRESKEYRKNVMSQLPGCYKWGCHCAPEACHGDILKKYVKRQLQIGRAHRREYEKKRANKSSTEGGDSKV